MLAYGYEWDSEAQGPDLLRETSLVCTGEELDLLIAFLQELRENGAPDDHRHFRDWCESWTQEQSDLIVFMSEHPWTKERQE